MKGFHRALQSMTPFIPRSLRSWVRSHVSLQDYDLARRHAENPFRQNPTATYPGSQFQLGIIEDPTQYHRHYVAACSELGVSYELVNLLASDWLERFQESRCSAFLVWPCSASTIWKETFDYRLRILENDLGRIIYPTWQECWLTEHKPRLRDWLDAHGLPHPRTWVFCRRREALEFCEEASLPIVVKTATGASSSGVHVIRTRGALARIVRRAFGRGLTPSSFDPRDRQWGFVYMQEYLPNVDEWRIVRIGDSFFGYRKERGPSGLHSASKRWSWLDPGPALLDLARKVTEIGGFTSMDVDIFLTEDGRLVINECQTVFGCTTPAIQMKVDDIEGRYLWIDGGWHFEQGSFCRNHMCNLRIEHLLAQLPPGRSDRADPCERRRETEGH